MATKNGKSDPIGVMRELEAIKRLLIFALVRTGASQRELAKALGVGQSSISRMFPSGSGRKPRSRKKEART